MTDVPWGRVFRIDPRGHWDLVVEYDGEPNGLKFLDDRRLVVADYMNGLLSLDVTTGEVRPFLTRRNTERFKGVNDLTFDSQGNLYFTDQGQRQTDRQACKALQAGCIACGPLANWTGFFPYRRPICCVESIKCWTYASCAAHRLIQS